MRRTVVGVSEVPLGVVVCAGVVAPEPGLTPRQDVSRAAVQQRGETTPMEAIRWREC